MKKFLLTIFLLILTLPVLAKNTILIIGDSLSAGYGIDVKQGWVALLQERLQDHQYQYEIINASISGDTTNNGLNRLPSLLTQHKPNITIIELGGNDGLRGLQLNTIQKNLQKMITLAVDAKSKVILVGVRLPPNYGPAYIKQFQQLYLDLADENNVKILPSFLAKVDDNPALMQTDGIHPNQQAQAIIVDNIWPVIEDLIKNKS